MISVSKLFLAVIRAFVNQTEIEEDLKPHFTDEVIEKLFKIAKMHDVLQIVSDVLFKNGLLPQNAEITKKYQKQQLNALGRYLKLEQELQKICELFEKNAVEFIPLKGAVLRKYYPEPYMRTSCDIDILVHEHELKRAISLIVSELNYKANDTVDYHDVSLFSPNGVLLELHYNLKEKRENLDKLLVEVWNYTINTENGQYYKLEEPEFYIFHHVAHMVNHFLRGGCGIRAFIDLFFIEKHLKYDYEKLHALLKESQTEAFYNTALKCTDVWFSSKPSCETVDLVEAFVLKGGSYGTKENRINVENNVKGGKLSYLLSRIFVPYNSLKYKYVILQKHKILLPLMWVVNIFSYLSPERRKRAKKELELHKNISASSESKMSAMLKELGI